MCFKSIWPRNQYLLLQDMVTVNISWAVVVAQLVERPLPTPEVRGSIPVISEIYIEHCFLSTVLKRRK